MAEPQDRKALVPESCLGERIIQEERERRRERETESERQRARDREREKRIDFKEFAHVIVGAGKSKICSVGG